MQAPSNMEYGSLSSSLCLEGLSLPVNHSKVRKGPLWVNSTTQPHFRKVFIKAGTLVTAITKAAKVFPLCYISLFSLSCNSPKVSPRRLKFSRPLL